MPSSDAKDVSFVFQKQSNGSIEVEVEIKNSKLIGKSTTFSLKRMCTVKDKRPVHKEITLFSESFSAKSTAHTFIIPKNK